MRNAQLPLPIRAGAKTGGMLYKAFSGSVRSVDEENRIIRFAASTEAVDRYGDIIRVNGWNLDNFNTNPVFLWAHRSEDPPIGKIVKSEKVLGAKPELVQSAQFAAPEDYPFADTIYRLFKSGFMNAVSVGFIPREWAPRYEDDEEGIPRFCGYEYTEQEQLELSAVPIPANPEALGKILKASRRNGVYDARKLGYEFLLEAVHRGIVKSDEADRLERFFSFGESNPPWAYSVPGVTTTEGAMSNGKQVPGGVRKDDADPDEVLEGLKARVSKVEEEHKALHDAHEETRAMCAAVQKDAAATAEDMDGLGKEHEKLKSAHAALSEKHEALEKKHAGLKDDHGELKEKFESFKAKVKDAIDMDGDEDDNGESDGGNIAGTEGAPAGVSKSVIPFREEKLAPVDEPWDAGKEQAKAQTPKARKRMSTVIVGDKGNLTSYKLPHHKGDGDFETVWRGVANALARFEQTDMPEGDRAGVRSHLARHKKEFGKDEEGLDVFETRLASLGSLYRQAKSAGLEEQAERLDKEIKAFVFASFGIEDGGTSGGNAEKTAPAGSDGKTEDKKVETLEQLFSALVEQ